MSIWDDDVDDGGLPDAAFTELELAAGVQHVVRTGDPNATSSGRRRNSRTPDNSGNECVHDGVSDDLMHVGDQTTRRFDTFEQAQTWARARPGRTFTRASTGVGFEANTTGEKLTNDGMQHGQFSNQAKPIGRRGNLIQPLKQATPYPVENPSAATWVVGTHPRTKDEWELFEIDMQNKREVFRPALERLSPSIAAKAKRRYDTMFLSQVMSSDFHKNQTDHDLFELLTLAERELERCKVWYASAMQNYEQEYNCLYKTEKDDFLPPVRHNPSTPLSPRMKKPAELVFWLEVVAIVMDELVDRV